MKRFSSSDSLDALMAICPNSTDEHNQKSPMYAMEFQTMLEEEGCVEEFCHVSEKKRRLSIDQVKALEKYFEVENKLEPERKVKLAHELGLQPRQVAVWFQNRRARWKTKRLERDYGVLKADYDGLKLNFDKLQHDNQSLLKEILELKSKLNEDGNSEERIKLVNGIDKTDEDTSEIKNKNGSESMERVLVFGDFKDGSSESDSSNSPHQFLNGSSSTSKSFVNMFSEMEEAKRGYQPQFVKIEEHNFFGEDCTTLFSDDQPPTLHWYCSDEWN